MCLIKGLEFQQCTHDWCKLAAKKPQYWAIFKADYVMNRQEIQQFKIIREKSFGNRVLRQAMIAVSPYAQGSPEANNFQSFKENTYAHTHGHWPADREIFDKSEVAYVLVEKNVSRANGFTYENRILTNLFVDTVDLVEVAIYVGLGCK